MTIGSDSRVCGRGNLPTALLCLITIFHGPPLSHTKPLTFFTFVLKGVILFYFILFQILELLFLIMYFPRPS